MATRACFIAILLGVSIGPAAQPRSPREQNVLIRAHQALVDVDSLGVVIEGHEIGRDALSMDLPGLKARVLEKLAGAGIKHLQSEAGPLPTLLVRIEGVAVPASDQCVWSVQVALVRLVTLPGQPDAQFQAVVWQGQPLLKLFTRQEAAEAVAIAVLARVEAFVAAHGEARSLLSPPQDIKLNVSAPTASGAAFVSSKSSQVFHRTDCRWAQNIASGNLIGYNSRQEAVQAGKRPCKTCQP